ncbi:hypothetical protein [Raineyella antarctica]|nr:hypothetical protein [Raineyella antarctica]
MAVLAIVVTIPMILGLTTAYAAPSGGASSTKTTIDAYKKKAENVKKKAEERITQQDRDKAIAKALQRGELNPLMTAATGTAAALAPGAAPHYFSHPNYANSPLPTLAPGTGAYVGNRLQDRAFATDYPVGVGQLAPVFVVVDTPLTGGFLTEFKARNQATNGGSPFPSAGNVFHAYVLRPTGTAGQYTVVFDSGLLTVPAPTTASTSEDTSYGVTNLTVQDGDRLAFYGQGIPVDTGAGNDILHYPAPTAPLQDTTITMGSTDYPVYPEARTYSFGATVAPATLTGGIRKFVDTLPPPADRPAGHRHLSRLGLLRDRTGRVRAEAAQRFAAHQAARVCTARYQRRPRGRRPADRPWG